MRIRIKIEIDKEEQHLHDAIILELPEDLIDKYFVGEFVSRFIDDRVIKFQCHKEATK